LAERLSLDLLLLLLVASSALLLSNVYRDRERWVRQMDRRGWFMASEGQPLRRPSWSLFAISFVGLFTEVMLIRWVGTEVRIFAFFQNLALIACFLGFGLGCYWAPRKKSFLISILAMTALVALVEAPIHLWRVSLEGLSAMLSLSSDSALWVLPAGSNPGTETLALLYASSAILLAMLLLLLVAVMIPIGQMVGFYLDSAPNPVRAYSVNLVGSMVGIWAFAALAFLRLPPECWFGLVFLVLLFFRPTLTRSFLLAWALVAVSLGLFRLARGKDSRVFWSPYQKLQVVDGGDRNYTVMVNNTGYMWISNMTEDYLARNPAVAKRYLGYSSYDAPFRFASSCDRVLIVGAGAGNDAAAALRNGAREVDAVEIDPVILSVGKALHPERPYSSPKVRLIVNDARAFLRQSKQKYDVVLFGLLDSHTQFSDFSNMRLDNYVYTEEAFHEAGRLLKTHGILVMKFEVRTPWTWMGQRFYVMLSRVFGRAPIVFYAPRLGNLIEGTVFVISKDSDLWARGSVPPLSTLISDSPPHFPLSVDSAPPPATDDWPYVYHRWHSIPRTFLAVSLVLLVLTLVLVRGVFDPRQPSTWHFFFLGAGFLLLETQLVSRLALYFGTTWLVNCVALTAILIVLVAANVYVARARPNRLTPYYLLLVATLLANYFYPWEHVTSSARGTGILLSAAYSLSVFFAGIIFTEAFRRAEDKSTAFGANIVGAVAGGLAQNVSFILGMKVLLLIAAIFYVFAAICGSRLRYRFAYDGLLGGLGGA